jgi:hypothetical protein
MLTVNNDYLITALYHWLTTFNDKFILKDMTKIHNIKYDCFVESSVSEPLSFTVFELSNKGELLIDSTQRLLESKAAFFVFVNPNSGWVFAIKNTLENQKKLINKEPIQNFKIKIIPD